MRRYDGFRRFPQEILFGNPDKTGPEISPDGTKMAYLAPVNNVLNVWVGTVGSDNYQPVTEDDDRGVCFYFWAQDNKHILYIQDVGGNENWRLYATNLENRETRDLTPFENVQAQIIKHDKHFPNELLIVARPMMSRRITVKSAVPPGWAIKSI